MFGLFVQLLLSWIMVWLFEKRNLSILGFKPSKKRLNNFFLFFFLTAACCASGFLMKMFFNNKVWEINPFLSATLVLEGIWWNLKSVLFEELVFRGVLLYILVNRIGMTKAVGISAVAFGIYHWFSFGIIGNPVGMAYTFVITGLMGLLLAYGYTRTLSLYIPVAIHLGWNFTQNFLFSQGPIGDGILIPVGSSDFRTDSLPVYILVTFLPLLLAISLNYFLLKTVAFPHQFPGPQSH